MNFYRKKPKITEKDVEKGLFEEGQSSDESDDATYYRKTKRTIHISDLSYSENSDVEEEYSDVDSELRT